VVFRDGLHVSPPPAGRTGGPAIDKFNSWRAFRRTRGDDFGAALSDADRQEMLKLGIPEFKPIKLKKIS
jgi:hypothetical protein